MSKTNYIALPAIAAMLLLFSINALSQNQNGGFIVGPGLPPKGWYNRKNAAIDIIEERKKEGVKILDVPRYLWTYGCSPTAAGMIIAYHDRNGYPNLVDGIAPYTNDIYGKPEKDTRGFCPWIASTEHIKDFWVKIGSKKDPFFNSDTNAKNWEPHCQPGEGNCLADLMGTSQYNVLYDREHKLSMEDGGTTFNYKEFSSAFSDGDWGIKFFFELRGYIIECDTSPKISGTFETFSFEDFCHEINSNRPVLVHLEGHSVVGIGYNITEKKIYLNDTYDYSVHLMEWEGTYNNSSYQIIRDITYIRPITQKDSSLPSIALNVNDSTMGKVYQGGIDPVYMSGSQTIKAAANEGYTFTGWNSETGNCIIADSNSAETTISINGEDTITANFAKDKPKYTVTFTVNGNGSISGNSTQIIYEGENSETVTVVPGTANIFTGWTGSIESSDNSLTVANVTQNMTITANFEERYYIVSFQAANGGSINGEKSQNIGHGLTATAVTAIAEQYYKFCGWSGSIESSDASLTVTNVTQSMTLTANFEYDPSQVDIKEVSLKKFVYTYNRGKGKLNIIMNDIKDPTALDENIILKINGETVTTLDNSWNKGKTKSATALARWKNNQLAIKAKSIESGLLNASSGYLDIELQVIPFVYKCLYEVNETYVMTSRSKCGEEGIFSTLFKLNYNGKKDILNIIGKGTLDLEKCDSLTLTVGEKDYLFGNNISSKTNSFTCADCLKGMFIHKSTDAYSLRLVDRIEANSFSGNETVNVKVKTDNTSYQMNIDCTVKQLLR